MPPLSRQRDAGQAGRVIVSPRLALACLIRAAKIESTEAGLASTWRRS